MYIVYYLWRLIYKDNHNYDEDQYLFNTMKSDSDSDISHNVINNC
jgi:hypothetical protein